MGIPIVASVNVARTRRECRQSFVSLRSGESEPASQSWRRDKEGGDPDYKNEPGIRSALRRSACLSRVGEGSLRRSYARMPCSDVNQDRRQIDRYAATLSMPARGVPTGGRNCLANWRLGVRRAYSGGTWSHAMKKVLIAAAAIALCAAPAFAQNDASANGSSTKPAANAAGADSPSGSGGGGMMKKHHMMKHHSMKHHMSSGHMPGSKNL